MKYDDLNKIFPSLMKEWMGISDEQVWQCNEGVSTTRMKNVINTIEGLDYELTKNLTLLDVGCECGIYSMYATQKFKKVIGIDSSKTAIKRAQKTKEIFLENGYDVSNFIPIQIEFQRYCMNPKYKVDNRGYNMAIWESGGGNYDDKVDNSDFFKNKVDALLCAEIVSLFDDQVMDFFDRVLNHIKLVMIQSKFQKKNQWEWDKSDYAQSPATVINKHNSYENYAMEEIVKYLKTNNYSNISVYPKNNDCGVVIGVL